MEEDIKKFVREDTENFKMEVLVHLYKNFSDSLIRSQNRDEMESFSLKKVQEKCLEHHVPISDELKAKFARDFIEWREGMINHFEKTTPDYLRIEGKSQERIIYTLARFRKVAENMKFVLSDELERKFILDFETKYNSASTGSK